MEKVLITGGSGFIGGHLVDELFGKYNITVLDNFAPQIHGNDYHNSFLYQKIKDRAEIIVGSVLDKELLKEVLKDVDYIFHLAAETGTGQSMYELTQYAEVNIVGLAAILEVIIQEKIQIKKIVLSSSRSVYGEGTYQCNEHGVVVPNSRDVLELAAGNFEVKCPICSNEVSLLKTSENAPPQPISFYAYTKWSQEKMLEQMCHTMDIPYTIFRYQNVYGRGQSLKNPYTGILSIFSKLMLENQDINIFEDGLESRDFVHVKDVAWYTAKSIEQPESDYQIINVGSGNRVTVLKVAESLKDLYQSESKLKISGDFRKGDIKHNVADMSKATTIFGEKDLIEFDAGIKDFSEWVKTEGVDQFDNRLNYEDSISELKKTGMFVSGKTQ